MGGPAGVDLAAGRPWAVAAGSGRAERQGSGRTPPPARLDVSARHGGRPRGLGVLETPPAPPRHGPRTPSPTGAPRARVGRCVQGAPWSSAPGALREGQNSSTGVSVLPALNPRCRSGERRSGGVCPPGLRVRLPVRPADGVERCPSARGSAGGQVVVRCRRGSWCRSRWDASLRESWRITARSQC